MSEIDMRSVEELAEAWGDGYQAGFNDNESCNHRSTWIGRKLFNATTREPWPDSWPVVPDWFPFFWRRGECKLYTTRNPYDTEADDE